MRTYLITAGLVAALGSASIASAQQTCEERSTNRAIGTVAGAGIGALLGNVIAGRGDKTLGTVIGGVGGGVAGNQLTKGSGDCARAYGYYDKRNTWHANDVRVDNAQGYYDRDGQWVNGAPNGYYDNNGRWVAGTVSNDRAGYRDEHGHWVPASANGYYDPENRYVGGSVSGHYENGRWVASPAVGRYDDYGRWIAGTANGRRDADGRWVAAPEPGYYDTSGRWNRGAVTGYYDTRGTWILTGTNQQNGNTGYGNNDRRDLASREARIDARIRRAYDERTLTYRERNRALTELGAIKRLQRRVTDQYGRIDARNEQMLQARLDRLNAGIRDARQDGRNG